LNDWALGDGNPLRLPGLILFHAGLHWNLDRNRVEAFRFEAAVDKLFIQSYLLQLLSDVAAD
jgi:hypothetical protein